MDKRVVVKLRSGALQLTWGEEEMIRLTADREAQQWMVLSIEEVRQLGRMIFEMERQFQYQGIYEKRGDR